MWTGTTRLFLSTLWQGGFYMNFCFCLATPKGACLSAPISVLMGYEGVGL